MMSAMMMERAGMGMASPAVGAGPMGTPAASPVGPGMMMVPRAAIKVEKCAGGLKLTCTCDDPTSAGMLQNLCTMMAGGLCSCAVMMNGLVVCSCHLTMGVCRCEMTEDGVCITCTSGDKDCGKMIQACGEAMAGMMQAGCTACVMMNHMPVCCGS